MYVKRVCNETRSASAFCRGEVMDAIVGLNFIITKIALGPKNAAMSSSQNGLALSCYHPFPDTLIHYKKFGKQNLRVFLTNFCFESSFNALPVHLWLKSIYPSKK